MNLARDFDAASLRFQSTLLIASSSCASIATAASSCLRFISKLVSFLSLYIYRLDILSFLQSPLCNQKQACLSSSQCRHTMVCIAKHLMQASLSQNAQLRHCSLSLLPCMQSCVLLVLVSFYIVYLHFS